MKPIDILMTTWHRPEITEKAILAIGKNTNPWNYRLIVIDNGSPKEMVEMLKELHDATYIDELILNKENIGLEPAHNQGLELIESDLFVIADNDCLPMKPDAEGDWLGKLIKLMEKYPDYAAISARTQVMIGTGNIFEEADKNDQEVVEFPHPGGSFRIMRKEAVKEVGGWRKNMAGRGSEEKFICEKLRDKGWKTGFAVQVRCYHQFGNSGEGQTDRWGYPVDWKPEDTGHSDVWHPALAGDNLEEIKEYYDINNHS